MARIPEAELERLKAEVSVQRLAEARGVELRRAGADLIGRCPFHDDREPSLVISPDKNLWHCMGACQAGGSCIDWVMRERGVSFRHAVELVRADLPSVAVNGHGRSSTVRTLPAPVAFDAGDQELLQQVVRYYHATLLESPEALQYLERRGLRDRELLERFQLGFANRTLGLRLPEKNRKAGADIRSRLQRLGVMRESGHEHFNGSLVVPVLDEDGQVCELYGRKITPGLRPGTPLHLYLPGPHRGVWNVAAFATAEEVIVTEALLDGLTLWALGLHHVTAAYGVEGFTDEHLAALQRHQVRRVLIAYDRDVAGDRAAVQLAVRLVAAGIDSYRVQLPQGEDVNSFACAAPATAAARLAERLRSAVWLGQGRPRSVRSPVPLLPAAPGREVETPAASTPALSAPDPVGAAPPPSEPPSASPLPPGPVQVPVELRGEELFVQLGERSWRVRGLPRTTTFDSLRINLLVRRDDDGPFHVDTIDLYSAKQRTSFTAQAARELGLGDEVIRRDLGTLLLRLEGLAEELATQAMQPQQPAVQLSDEETEEALRLLRDPRLLERVLLDFERCGVVGEESNKLVAYLAVTSRLLEQPLAVVVQSTSAAGKSVLLDAVLAFVPAEERIKYSAMTGQSLYYMAERDLRHKVLAVVEEEGAERAAYALKLLQSEGELCIASTGKDASTGRLVTHEYRVSGPVAILLTTSAIDVDEELLNRCLVLAVDEEREQTRAIHQRQRQAQTLAGLLAAREVEHIRALHHNAQRLLRPLLVANPYAESLRFADERTRTRRDHQKYLTLIRAVALLHQHQHEHKVIEHGGERLTYIEVSAADIAVANRLAHAVLGRSLDELPPQTRRLLERIDALVGEQAQRDGVERGDVRFTRREVRACCGGESTQVACHLARLVELEYLLVHRGGRGQSFVYELLWDGAGRDGTPQLDGLIDPDALPYDGHLPGQSLDLPGSNGDLPGSFRPQIGAFPGGFRGQQNGRSLNADKESLPPFAAEVPHSTSRDGNVAAVVHVPD